MEEYLTPILAKVKTLYDALTTSTRMANLDNLDAAVSGVSPIRSIQPGSIAMGTATTATATISAVTLGKSVVIFGGVDAGSSTNTPDDYCIRVALTNATTVTATRNGSHNGCHVNFTVVEYK